MPTYEYECVACGLRFEAFHGMSDPPPAACSRCGGRLVRMISAGAAVIARGGGPSRSSCSRLSAGGPTCCGRDGPCAKPSCER